MARKETLLHSAIDSLHGETESFWCILLLQGIELHTLLQEDFIVFCTLLTKAIGECPQYEINKNVSKLLSIHVSDPLNKVPIFLSCLYKRTNRFLRNKSAMINVQEVKEPWR